ncbi:MAG: VWA domain-containing protein [Bacilli bacterium]|nr:VWA domain-containing protein [Bacilli bacterium]
MVIFPIIPIWVISIVCVLLIVIIFKYNKKSILRILMVILVFIINLRIMIPGSGSESLSSDLDVLLVVDSTISMNALDYGNKETRLSGAKKDCENIINELEGSRFSIISFDNNAKVLVPFTYDSDIALSSIDLITPISELYARGSSLNTPYDAILDVLKSDSEDDKRSKIIFFISDGEITDESKLKSFKELSKYVSGGAVLGYGTEKGGNMKYKNKYSDEERYLMDYSGSYGMAVSKIDEKNLKKISSDLRVDYINMNNHNNINYKLKEIKRKNNLRVTANDKSSYKDIYFIFIIPLLILMVLDFYKIRRKFI